MLATPFGDLHTLDLSDSETQRTILFHDKHQVLEGIVAENHIDQVLDRALASAQHLHRLDVVSVLANWNDHGTTRRMAIVLDQGTPTELLQPYMVQLAKKFPAKLVRYDEVEREFFTHRGSYAAGISAVEPWDKLTTAMGFAQASAVDVAVRDSTRQQQSFWGQIVGTYKERLGREVILPRVFKNFAVQPYFDRGVWDLDRVYYDDEAQSYGVIEVKHKFPFGKEPYPLNFGLNCGSCGVLRDLADAGFQCFHSIMVKPFWNDRESVTYLFNNIDARSRVLFIGKRFSYSDLQKLCAQKASRSPSKTTLTGQGDLSYVRFRASSLYRIGRLNDEGLSSSLVAGLTGKLDAHVTDEELRRLKMPE